MKTASEVADPAEAAIAKELALLIANDALKYPISKAKVQGTARPLQQFDDEALSNARLEIAIEMESSSLTDRKSFDSTWSSLHDSSITLPGLAAYTSDDEVDEVDEHQLVTEAFDNVQSSILTAAEKGNKLEKKMALHYGGYQQRSKTLRQKIVEAAEALEKEQTSLDTFRTLQISEQAALPIRLEALGEEVAAVKTREMEAQEKYRARREELAGLREGMTNGGH